MAGKHTSVTVLTPSYNQGEFIGETIDSVISQRGHFNIEYIILDGGSTDDSISIIKNKEKELSKRPGSSWPRIRFLGQSRPDGGQVNALNQGFKMATGDILVWLNSDDTFCSPVVLEQVIDYFNHFPETDVLTGNGYLIDKNSNRYSAINYLEVDLLECIYLDYPVLQPATFISKRIYSKEVLQNRYQNCFDAEYFIRLLNQGVIFRKTVQYYACFRYYKETKTVSAPFRRYKEMLDLSRRYGSSVFFRYVAALYRFVEIYLMSTLDAAFPIRAIRKLLYKISYRIILKRWQRQ